MGVRNAFRAALRGIGSYRFERMRFRQKKLNPALVGGVRMKKRKEYLYDFDSIPVDMTLGQALPVSSFCACACVVCGIYFVPHVGCTYLFRIARCAGDLALWKVCWISVSGRFEDL